MTKIIGTFRITKDSKDYYKCYNNNLYGYSKDSACWFDKGLSSRFPKEVADLLKKNWIFIDYETNHNLLIVVNLKAIPILDKCLIKERKKV